MDPARHVGKEKIGVAAGTVPKGDFGETRNWNRAEKGSRGSEGTIEVNQPTTERQLMPIGFCQKRPDTLSHKVFRRSQFKNHVSRGAKQSGNFSGNPAAAFSEHEFSSGQFVCCFFEHFFGIEFRALLVPDSCQFWCRVCPPNPPTHHSSHICLARKPPCYCFTDVYLSANST